MTHETKEFLLAMIIGALTALLIGQGLFFHQRLQKYHAETEEEYLKAMNRLYENCRNWKCNGKEFNEPGYETYLQGMDGANERGQNG